MSRFLCDKQFPFWIITFYSILFFFYSFTQVPGHGGPDLPAVRPDLPRHAGHARLPAAPGAGLRRQRLVPAGGLHAGRGADLGLVRLAVARRHAAPEVPGLAVRARALGLLHALPPAVTIYATKSIIY